MAKKTAFTTGQLDEISRIQQERNVTRKTAIKLFHKAAKKAKAGLKTLNTRIQDVKMAQANDKPDPEAPTLLNKLIPRTAVGKGIHFHQLAGSPSKQAVIAVFGKSGYNLSWLVRAERLGIPVEELCARFKQDANAVKEQWAALSANAGK